MALKSTRTRLEQVYQDRVKQVEIMLAKNMSAQSHLMALEYRDKYLKALRDIDRESI